VRSTNPVEARVLAQAEPIAEAMGYRLVRVRLNAVGRRSKTLQIMAERLSDGHMGVDDCSRLSRALSNAFDAEDPISGEYDLELSSPGIDRPLMRLEDFERFAGHDAKLETAALVDGRKRFKGVIMGVDGEHIRLNMAEGEALVPFSALVEARLMLTDRLIEEDLRRAKKAAEQDDENERKLQ
jgi:ribosome maturation factor RimP